MTDHFTLLIQVMDKVMDNPDAQRGIKRYIRNYWKARNKTLERHPETVELAKEVRRIKIEALENMDQLVKTLRERIEERGGHFHLASTAEDARNIIGEIVGSGKIVVKAKSMVTEEIMLRQHLERLGNEVWETDLGELLVQLEKGKPMHMVAPAIHIPRERAANLISRLTGKTYSPDTPIGQLVSEVRTFLRDKFIKAHVGISGANVVAADTGSLIIVENEGNIRLSTGLPPVHIAVIGYEKIVPTLVDAFKTVTVLMRYGGFPATRYVNVITGPSATADIEHQIIQGVHGPKELHVVLLDNGRKKALKDPVLREALLCLRCGACLSTCPVFEEVAGAWGGHAYSGGIGAIWTYITEGPGKGWPLAYMCALMGRCKEACPLNIDIPGMIREIRKRHASQSS